MKKDKLEKISFICYLAASVCFYISAFFSFISKSTGNSNGVVCLCLGSAFLCLASVNINKNRKE